MIEFRSLSVALIAVAVLATPSMACTRHGTTRHLATKANASAAPTARSIEGYARTSAPRVTLPAWCDVGDNPFMC